MRRELVQYSKFLSLVLRHDPASVGVKLDAAGWVNFDKLLAAMKRKRTEITREIIVEVVETNEKQRFAFSPDMSKIRASQGHSIGVELGLKPAEPPEFLFHGTTWKNIPSIRKEGLLRGKRDHVHLSADEATATNVGARHGKPVILTVEARRLVVEGHAIYLSDNGVWLTSHVPAEFILFSS